MNSAPTRWPINIDHRATRLLHRIQRREHHRRFWRNYWKAYIAEMMSSAGAAR